MSSDPEKAMDDHDHESLDEDEDEGGDHSKVTAALLKDPAVMAALQGRLQGMIGSPSGYIKSLPEPVKRRIKALKKLQLEATEIEAKFYEEIHALEVKYHKMYTPIYDRRTKITKGDYEPKDGECEWPSDEEDEELSEDMKERVKLEESKVESNIPKDAKGVPEFWLTIFKNVEMLQEMVQEHDMPALVALEDITVSFSEKPMSFTLHFHFAPNEYFSDTVLTKKYDLRCEVSKDDPFSFDGPEIFKCSGCTVNWKQGKNLTVKTVKKKQKHKSKGSVRTVTKQVKNDSFFNFFDPPQVPEDVAEEDIDPETQDLLTADFEIGHYIRERVVPRAVLFFTGEALEDDEDYDEEDEDDDDEDGEDDEDEDNDPDFDPAKAPKGANPQECKQQ
jgi:nucleosome assembly protein 1-like 1